MSPETYILVPSVVVDKARRLANAGLYQQALDMLQRNRVEADVYPTHVEMRLPSEKHAKTKREQFISKHRMVRTNKSRHANPWAHVGHNKT